MAWVKSTDGKRMEWFPDEQFQLFLQEQGYRWKRVGQNIRYWQEVENPGVPMSEKKPTAVINSPAFWAVVFALDAGNEALAYENFEKAMGERFDAGEEYAKDTLHDWYQPSE
jgi:hypothetical protein